MKIPSAAALLAIASQAVAGSYPAAAGKPGSTGRGPYVAEFAVVGEHTFDARVVALDGNHGVVHGLAGGGQLGACLDQRASADTQKTISASY